MRFFPESGALAIATALFLGGCFENRVFPEDDGSVADSAMGPSTPRSKQIVSQPVKWVADPTNPPVCVDKAIEPGALKFEYGQQMALTTCTYTAYFSVTDSFEPGTVNCTKRAAGNCYRFRFPGVTQNVRINLDLTDLNQSTLLENPPIIYLENPPADQSLNSREIDALLSKLAKNQRLKCRLMIQSLTGVAALVDIKGLEIDFKNSNSNPPEGN